MPNTAMTRATFALPFVDFDYEHALPDYKLFGKRRAPAELTVVGYEVDINTFENEMCVTRL